MKFGVEPTGVNLKAPAPPDAPAAVLGKAYECSLPLVYSSEEATLTMPDIQVLFCRKKKLACSFGHTCVQQCYGECICFLGLSTSILSSGDLLTGPM